MLIQLATFCAIALIAIAVMSLQFLKLPAKLFGIGRYTVTVELPESGGLYGTGNVTYRGVEVGRVQTVKLTDTGVRAVLSLKSGIDIPSDLKAEVHSQSAIGEQYVNLIPRNGSSRPLKDGDIIPISDTSVPPDINSLLDAANTGLQAIPRENLKTAIDEAYTAVGGLGPQLSEIVKGSTTLAIDARKNLDPLISLIDNSKPVLDSQSQSAQAIRAWAAHLATVTSDLQSHNDAVSGFIGQQGIVVTSEEARRLVERLKPTLPVLAANLASVGQVGIDYQNSIEQLLVTLPQAVASGQGTFLANANTKQAYKGEYLSFNLNVNLPPACTTGFLPAQQARDASLTDYPDRAPGTCTAAPAGLTVQCPRARNIPCETRPGKRAPRSSSARATNSTCPERRLQLEGDPNATLSGQDIPQLAPASAAPLPDAPNTALPATQTDKTWQSMLLPPGS